MVEKTDTLNTTLVSGSQKKYEIKASKGAVIFFRLFASGGSQEVDAFLFSPDIGEIGFPIDCEFEGFQFFCYYPPSLIQISVQGDGTIEKIIEETGGWCRDYENGPLELYMDNSSNCVDVYKLPLIEKIVDWSSSCPEYEITEITQ